jgi:hypothetical protein
MEGEKGCDGVAIQATMLDAIVSERDKEMILEAALSKKPVQLAIFARKVGGEYRAAKIASAKRIETASK